MDGRSSVEQILIDSDRRCIESEARLGAIIAEYHTTPPGAGGATIDAEEREYQALRVEQRRLSLILALD